MSRNTSLLLLSSIFVASLITANLIGSKLVLLTIFGTSITVSVGLFVIPMTFMACSLINEMHGSETATKVVWIGLIVQIYALALVMLGGALPASPRRDLTEAYRQMYSLTPRMVLASIVAYTVSQLADVKFFRAIRERTGAKHFWLRKNLSTIAGQAIDTSIFMVIFLGGVLPPAELAKSMLIPYLIKVLMSLADTPFTYLGLRILKGRQNDGTSFAGDYAGSNASV